MVETVLLGDLLFSMSIHETAATKREPPCWKWTNRKVLVLQNSMISGNLSRICSSSTSSIWMNLSLPIWLMDSKISVGYSEVSVRIWVKFPGFCFKIASDGGNVESICDDFWSGKSCCKSFWNFKQIIFGRRLKTAFKISSMDPSKVFSRWHSPKHVVFLKLKF